MKILNYTYTINESKSENALLTVIIIFFVIIFVYKLIQKCQDCIIEDKPVHINPIINRINSLNVTQINFYTNSKCSICQDKLLNIEEDYVVKLNCNHFYHKDCSEKWITLSKNSDCPLCRENIKVNSVYSI